MAIMDARLEFCDGSSLAAAVGTTVIGNVIDLGSFRTYNDAARDMDIGDGTPVYLHARIGTIAAAAHTATLAFYLQEASTNTPASFANKLTLKAAANVSTTVAGPYVAGYRIYDGALPSMTYKRYLRIASTVATTPIASGTVDCFLSLDPA